MALRLNLRRFCSGPARMSPHKAGLNWKTCCLTEPSPWISAAVSVLTHGVLLGLGRVNRRRDRAAITAALRKDLLTSETMSFVLLPGANGMEGVRRIPLP